MTGNSVVGTDLFSSVPCLLLQLTQFCDQSRHLQQQSTLQRGLAPNSMAWNCSHPAGSYLLKTHIFCSQISPQSQFDILTAK